MKKLFKNLLLFVLLITSSNLVQAQISGPWNICQNSGANYTCSAAATYNWSVSPSGTETISDPNIQNPYISFSAAGNYTVTLNTTAPIGTFTLGVTILTQPIISISSNSPVCVNSSINLASNANGGGSGISYAWAGPNGFASNSPSITIANAIVLESGTYTLSAIGVCGASLDSISIIVNPLPTANINSVVPGCIPLCADFALVPQAGSNIVAHSWDLGDGTFASGNDTIFQHCYATPNQYTISCNITDVYGCSNNISFSPTIVSGFKSISGTIYLNSTPITSGQVYLYTQPAMTNMYYCIDTVSVNASGQYLFSSVTSGNYLVKCVPDSSLYPNAISTYYGNAVQWDSSMVINHDCVNDFVADINLIETVMMLGPGFISGHVLEGAGFGGKMINPVNEVMVPGGPLKNVCVNLMKIPGGGAHGQASTDSTGYFEFANVPIGSYYLQVDIPGLSMDSTYFIDIDGNMFMSGVNSTASSVFTNLDFMADDQGIFMIDAIGINELKTKTEEISVYPNPAKSIVTIKAKGFETKAHGIELINSQGQSVFIDQQSAASDYILDLKKLNITSGLYVVKLNSGNVIKTTKLIIE